MSDLDRWHHHDMCMFASGSVQSSTNMVSFSVQSFIPEELVEHDFQKSDDTLVSPTPDESLDMSPPTVSPRAGRRRVLGFCPCASGMSYAPCGIDGTVYGKQ